MTKSIAESPLNSPTSMNWTFENSSQSAFLLVFFETHMSWRSEKSPLPSFQRMLMVCVPSVATARSLNPSQLKSPIATSWGSRLVVYERATDALAVEAIAAVVESSISMTRNMLRARLLRWLFFGDINITSLPTYCCTLIPLLSSSLEKTGMWLAVDWIGFEK